MSPAYAGPPLSALGPVPDARPLPADYARHAPAVADLRTVVHSLVAGPGWAGLSWAELVEELIAVGRTDIPLGRLVEGHVDALRTADQTGHRLADGALYGIWASRSGATGVRVRTDGDTLVLDGVLRFASGAGVIDRSLVPVWTADDHHLLVDLDVSGLPVDGSGWQSGAMTVSRTHTVTLVEVRVPADAVVGPRDFYLDRPAFLPGGVGVAAVWAGGLARLVDALLRWLRRSTPLVDLRLGRLRTHLVLTTAAVRQAGLRLDGLLTPGGQLHDPAAADLLGPLCTEARAAVAQTVRVALEDARAVAGAAGLAFDAGLTHAIDDLGLYTAQQPADADAEALGLGWRSV